ncbi:MAG: hypothetical protein JNL67_21570 [Planctomycetaceae bacterium]|nr:hypothetical protein [Planctomycetaceae bacterium]
MNLLPRPTWLRRLLLLLFVCAYLYFAWNNAVVLVVRNSSTLGGRGLFDLQKQLVSASPDVRLAAAQRLAETSGSTELLGPLIDSVWQDENRRRELGWYIAQAASRLEDHGAEFLAIVALDRHDAAIQRFETLPQPTQVDALLRLLRRQDLRSDRGSSTANQIAEWLGRFGENFNYPEKSSLSQVPVRDQTLARSDRFDTQLATKVATELLDHYREYELPPMVELALVQLGEPAVVPICNALTEGLDTDVHFGRRIAYYRTLSRLGPLAVEAESTLLHAIASERVNQAFYAAVEALIAIEPPDRTAAGQVIRAAMIPERWEPAGYDWSVIEEAGKRLLQRLGDAATIDQMVDELQGQRISPLGVRIAAINAPESWRTIRMLGLAGRRAQPTMELLMKGLESHSPEVRVESALAVYRVGEARDAALRTLEQFLDPYQNTPDNIGLALVAIAEIGWPAERPNEPLMRLLSSGPTVEVRQLAASVLHRSRVVDEELTDILVSRLLAESDAQVGQLILNLVVERLAELETSGLREIELTKAMEWLREKWSVPGEALTGEMKLQGWLAEQTLKQAGPEGAIALAQWIVEVADCPPEALELFASLGDSRQATVSVLSEAVQSADMGISRRAVVALGQMGKLAQPAFATVAATEFPETEEALRKIDAQAFLARSARNAEWYFLWTAPFLLVIVPLVERMVKLVHCRRDHESTTARSLSEGQSEVPR